MDVYITVIECRITAYSTDAVQAYCTSTCVRSAALQQAQSLNSKVPAQSNLDHLRLLLQCWLAACNSEDELNCMCSPFMVHHQQFSTANC